MQHNKMNKTNMLNNNVAFTPEVARRALMAAQANAPEATGFHVDREGNVQAMMGTSIMQVSQQQQMALNTAFTPVAGCEGDVDKLDLAFSALKPYQPLIQQARVDGLTQSFLVDVKVFRNDDGSRTTVPVARADGLWKAIDHVSQPVVTLPKSRQSVNPRTGVAREVMDKAYAYEGIVVKWDEEAKKLVLSDLMTKGAFVVLDPDTREEVPAHVLLKERKQRVLNQSPYVFRIMRQRDQLVARLFRCGTTVFKVEVDEQKECVVSTHLRNPWFSLTPEQAEQVRANEVYTGLPIANNRMVLLETTLNKNDEMKEHESNVSGRPWTYMVHPRALELLQKEEDEHMRMCLDFGEQQAERQANFLARRARQQGIDLPEVLPLVNREEMQDATEEQERNDYEQQLVGIEAAFTTLKQGGEVKFDLGEFQRQLARNGESNFHA